MARGVMGGALLALAGIVVAVLLVYGSHQPVAWTCVTVAAISGAFAVFEASIGWCAARAMGFKTKI